MGGFLTSNGHTAIHGEPSIQSEPPGSSRRYGKRRTLSIREVALVIETPAATLREMPAGIARFVRERGAWSIFHESVSASEAAGRLAQWKGDGIIAAVASRDMAAALAAAGVPVVDVLGHVTNAGFPVVQCDHEAVATMAAAHLDQCGCRAFAFVGIGECHTSGSLAAAFAAAVTAFGAGPAVFRPDRRNTSWQAGQIELAKWLAGLPRPVGILAADDSRGRCVLDAARRGGLSVPREVAVVGVGNDEVICELADPPLSSVRPDDALVGYRAAELLDRLMRRERPPARPIVVPPIEVVVRQSTHLATDDPDILRALRFIRQHACDGIRVEQVAAQAQLSRSTLKRRFQAAMKRSVHDEILRVRLRRAQDLLCQTDLPLDAVAERAGFRHQEYMGAVFRAKLDRTPAEFRRRRA
jgi:LacI family transcriptional regulator